MQGTGYFFARTSLSTIAYEGVARFDDLNVFINDKPLPYPWSARLSCNLIGVLVVTLLNAAGTLPDGFYLILRRPTVLYMAHVFLFKLSVVHSSSMTFLFNAQHESCTTFGNTFKAEKSFLVVPTITEHILGLLCPHMSIFLHLVLLECRTFKAVIGTFQEKGLH